MKQIPVSIGIITYNEEHNLARILDSFLTQKTKVARISEIIIISSGSTDKTNSIAAHFAKQYPFISLIKQRKRLGKASAVNLFISQAKEEIVVLSSADILLAENTLEDMIKPFRKKHTGIVGSHPIPLNDPTTFFGFSAHLLWKLHHQISLQTPKMGECIAFRKVFRSITESTVVDEANIEAIITAQGYQSVYADEAIIYNKGTETLKEFVTRRSTIYAGHLATKQEHGYEVATLNQRKIMWLLLKQTEISWRFMLWTPIVITLEAYSRLLGLIKYKTNIQLQPVWEIAPTTKKLPQLTKLNE